MDKALDNGAWNLLERLVIYSICGTQAITDKRLKQLSLMSPNSIYFPHVYDQQVPDPYLRWKG
jgi:hypothetical protein